MKTCFSSTIYISIDVNLFRPGYLWVQGILSKTGSNIVTHYKTIYSLCISALYMNRTHVKIQASNS